ncbi:hypothetical protein DH2020_038663 [Rehmannia glutinosa]|uniref:HAT C-terminal dimerisation domain-containing protein n=1 Tax=Rehmannia glutinosa TaxID=99300 RepID=A0ABR0UZL3_REHGL
MRHIPYEPAFGYGSQVCDNNECSNHPHIDPIDIGMGSMEKGNTVLAAKPRKKTMTSIYLKYFETALDGKSRRIHPAYAPVLLVIWGGTSATDIRGYDKIGDPSNNPAPQPVIVAKKPQTQAKLPTMELDHLNWLLINRDLEWGKVPNRVREVFRSMQETVRLIVEQVTSKVSVTLDFWTSYEQILYMSVTCQWIDENWSFQKVLLDICHIPSPCGGSEIYFVLLKVLRMYNLETKILAITHDNNPNALHACHTLKGDMDSQKLAAFCYIPCAAHTLNSIINDGLRTTKSVILKIREFVLELNSSSEISEDFVQFTTAYQEGNWKFPLDASARWSGSYQMLDIARKASKSMDTVIRKYEEQLGGRLLLNSAEKNAKAIWRRRETISLEIIPPPIFHPSPIHTPRARRWWKFFFAEEIARKKRRATMNSATDELTQYLSEPPAPMPTDVMDWWKVNSSRYPRLSLMARDFLAVQSTAVMPEDIFSAKGDEIDRQRFSTHDAIHRLCFV